MTGAPMRERIEAMVTLMHGSRLHLLDDGRQVSLRRAVPTDAPRLGPLAIRNEPGWGRDLVALDDHGSIVGLANPATVVVADGWADSELDALLTADLEE